MPVLAYTVLRPTEPLLTPQMNTASVSLATHPKLSPYAAYRFWRVVRRRLGSSTVYCQPCLRQNASASCAPGSKQYR